MADDVNRSKFGALNQLRARLDVRTVREAEVLERKSRLQQELEWKLSGGEVPALSPEELRSDIANIIEEQRGVVNTLEGIKSTRSVGPLKLFQQQALSAISPRSISSGVNAMMKTPGTFQAGLNMAGMADYQLHSMMQNAMNSTAVAGSAMHEAAGGVTVDPNSGRIIGGEAYGKAEVNFQGSLQDTANVARAQQLRRRMGLDIESRALNARDTFGKLSAGAEDDTIRENVLRGKAGTRGDVESTYKSSMSGLDAALKKQIQMTDKTGEAFEKLQKEIDGFAKSAEDAKKTLDEMNRTGRGGGWRGGLQIASAAMKVGGELLDTWSYENPVREAQNTIRFAQMGNQQYGDMLGGLGGDVGALRRLGGTYGRMQSTNNTTQLASKTSTLLGMGSGAIDSFIGGIKSGDLIGAFTGAASSINQGFASFRQQAGERGSQRAMLTKEQEDALNAINDQSGNAFMQQAQAMAGSSIGMGRLRGNLFDSIMTEGSMNAQAGAGLSPARVAALTGMAVQGLGGQFSNTNTIVRAGQVEQGGMMSAEQYLQSAGKLSNVSGNAQGNLEEIMRNAVASGLDTSKNLAQLVDLNSQLSSRTAAMGIDTSGGIAELVGRSVDAQNAAGVPTNMRAGATQNAVQFEDNATTSGDLSLSNVMKMSGFRRAGAKGIQDFRAAGKLTMGMIQTLQNGGPEAQALVDSMGSAGKDMLESRDKNGKFTIDQTKVERVGKELRQQIVREITGGPGAIPANQTKAFVEKGTVTPGSELQAAMFASGLSSSAVGGTFSRTQANKDNVPTTTPGGAGEINKQMIDLATAQAKQLEYGNKVIGSLDKATAAMNSIATTFDPAKMSVAVKEAATDFKIPVQAFSDAVGIFAASVSAGGFSKKGTGN